MNEFVKNILFGLIAAVLFCLLIEFLVFCGLRLSLGAEGLESLRVKYGRIEGPSIEQTAEEKKLFYKNRFGFLGPEFKIRKTKDTFRLLVMGASATSRGLSGELRDLLQRQCPVRYCEVIDGGVPGSVSAHEVYNLQRWLVYSPDLVIVLDGENDVYYSHYAPQGYLDETRSVLRRARRWHRIDYWFIRYSYTVQALKAFPHMMESMPKAREANSRSLSLSEKKSLSQFQPAPLNNENVIKTSWFGRENSYVIDPQSPVKDNFSHFYRSHIIQMAKEARRQRTPIIFFLQPSLVSKSGQDFNHHEKEVLASFPKYTSEDWIRTAALLYPAADQAQRAARLEHGRPYFDFSDLGRSVDFKFFSDLVHLTPEGNRMAAEAILDSCRKVNAIRIR